jgi:hypothetical protein
MKEKRKFHRWPCEFACITEIDSQQYQAVVHDLSYGGARISQTLSLPSTGTLMNLTIFPEEGDSRGTPLRALVTHVSEEEGFYGVQFYGNSDELNNQVSKIIDEKLAVRPAYNFSFDKKRF